jgi:hypothetical protein
MIEKKANEERLLNEFISDKMKEAGVNCPLRFKGTLNFTAIFVKQDQKNGKKDSMAALEGDIFLNYLNKNENYNYGFEISAKANSGIIKQGNPIVRTSYLFLESEKYGGIRVGYTSTASDFFSINGSKVLVGYGGVGSGNLSLFYNESAASLLCLGFLYDDNKAAKVVILSPKIAFFPSSGFSLAISFTPDSRSVNPFKTLHPKPRNPEINEEKADFPARKSAYCKNILTGALLGEFGDPQSLNAQISLAYYMGKGKTSITEIEVSDIRAFNIGAILGYKDFKLSLGFTDNGKSLRSKRYVTADIDNFDEKKQYTFSDPEVGIKTGADSGKVYSFGASYDITKKLVVSAGYFHSVVKLSDKEKTTAKVITLAGEYTFNKTISAYIEYNRINSDTCARAQAYNKACELSTMGKNSANVFMIGGKVNI